MFMLAVSAVLVLSLFVLLGINFEKRTFRLHPKQILSLLPLLLLFANFFTVIPANTVGIQYSPFTGVKDETLSEGFRYKGFFDTIYQIETQVQTKRMTAITGQTKDSQYVTIALDVQYKVDSATAFQVFREFRTLLNVDEKLIPNVVQRAIESVTTHFNVYAILGESKTDVYKEIELELQKNLLEHGISFYGINFVDVDAGENIERAIQAQAVATQAVETAEQERLRAEIEAQKRVVEAQADQEKAQIEAETLLIAANAQAEANRILSESITAEILQQQYIEAIGRWRPSVIGGEAYPTLQLPAPPQAEAE